MFVIGVAGGSGSGKTTLVRRLAESEFASHISLLAHDAYYLNADQMPDEIRRSQNWDHPESLDNPLFVEHIDRLCSGHAVEQPSYDFSTHTRRRETTRVEPRPILLLEGILLFALREICSRIQLRVFVDTPADLRMIRRILRDVTERGRTLSDIVDQYQATVKPMHDRFVEPSKVRAHLIVPWELHNDQAVEVLLSWIRYKVPSSRFQVPS